MSRSRWASTVFAGIKSNSALPRQLPCSVNGRRADFAAIQIVHKASGRGQSKVRELPIGIFDSGLGGLTVVRAVHRLLPHERILYLGDTARVPYGTKSPATVVRFAHEDMQFLMRQRVKAVIVACNTVSAWALAELEETFDVPVFGVIVPGAMAAAAATRNGRIGVIGTAATIRSKAYERIIRSTNRSAVVHARACPLLVPLVEEGWMRRDITRQVVADYIAPLLKKRIDTLVLGCTHYPLLAPVIQNVAGEKVRLIDSAQSCARYVEVELRALGLLNESRSRGWIRLNVTDEVVRFGEIARRFLGQPAGKIKRVDLSDA
ncbi:MAG: glutamate racemase [Pedosphaera sp.]|nr:glutamate racemase [Pedosphaera sp.]